jgi:hypothetical protein
VLVDDDLYRPLSKDARKGRPSLPPSLVVLTMLLQYYDDCSDRETEAQYGSIPAGSMPLDSISRIPASMPPSSPSFTGSWSSRT